MYVKMKLTTGKGDWNDKEKREIENKIQLVDRRNESREAESTDNKRIKSTFVMMNTCDFMGTYSIRPWVTNITISPIPHSLVNMARC